MDRPYLNESFNFSNRWLESYKKRHHISSTRRSGESEPVDMNAITQALPAIQAMLETFELEDIYSMDKTVLNYRTLVDHSLFSRQSGDRK